MSLRPEELALLAAELDRELEGGVVQKVHAPSTTRIYLEVRVPGRSALLLLCCDPGVARISAVDERPANPPTPPTWQSVLRRELTGAKLVDAEAVPERRSVLLHFTKAERRLALVLEVGTGPALVLTTGEGRVLSQSVPARPGLRVGQPWVPLEAHPVKAAASRLLGEHTFLRLAHAAETLLGTAEQKHWVDARRAPLLSKLKRLDRTRTKVRIEAERTEQAARFRREGELLTQNLHRFKRGQASVLVTEYLEDGSTAEVEVALDPKRTPQEEVAWRFHQYKRFTRGGELARARLTQLDAEEQALRLQLETLAQTPAELPVGRTKVAAQPTLGPYREYLGHGGERIWVGRGSTRNDELTFHVARPFHLWLHARGVPGAHVVIPLEKNAEVPAELLLDAATLAAHHSDAKGEPRVEISYTPVRFVHKTKGAAPGAVSYTREKTLLLRLENARLQRLLATCV